MYTNTVDIHFSLGVFLCESINSSSKSECDSPLVARLDAFDNDRDRLK